MKQTFMESLQTEKSNNTHLFTNANCHQHSRVSWWAKIVRRSPYHRLRCRWGRTWKQLRWNTGIVTMRAADQQWNFAWLHKCLTVCNQGLKGLARSWYRWSESFSVAVWTWNRRFSCYQLGVTGLGTLPCYSKLMIQMSFRWASIY